MSSRHMAPTSPYRRRSSCPPPDGRSRAVLSDNVGQGSAEFAEQRRSDGGGGSGSNGSTNRTRSRRSLSWNEWRGLRVGTRKRWSASVSIALLATALGGPLPAISALIICQALVFNDIINFATSHLQVPSFRPLAWHFFVSCLFFAYGRAIRPFALATPFVRDHVWPLLRYHSLLSFTFLFIGLLSFVGQLSRHRLGKQFSAFAWTIVTLVFVVLHSFAAVLNIFEGLIWFVLPVLLIVVHDIFSYVFNRLFGRTPMSSSLSTYRTWEGFAGASIATIIAGFFAPLLFSGYQLFTCAHNDLSFATPSCLSRELFAADPINLPGSDIELWIVPIQISGVFLAVFASLCAPLSGILTTALKLSFGIPVFDEASLYGFKSVTDRVHSQMLMSLATAAYVVSFARPSAIEVNTVVDLFTRLSSPQQVEALQRMQDILAFVSG